MSDLKVLLNDQSPLDQTEDGYGIRMAVQGIANQVSQRNFIDLLLENRDRLNAMKRNLKERYSSSWSDNLDRSYFHTWMKFINYVEKRLRQDSVVENPGEKE